MTYGTDVPLSDVNTEEGARALLRTPAQRLKLPVRVVPLHISQIRQLWVEASSSDKLFFDSIRYRYDMRVFLSIRYDTIRYTQP